MRKILYLVILLPVLAVAQKKTDSLTLPLKDGKLYFEKVINIEGTVKGTMFENANRWLIKTFSENKSIIQDSDKEAGNIIAKCSTIFETKGVLGDSYPIRFLVELNLRDGKYRIIFSNFEKMVGVDYYPIERSWKNEQLKPRIGGWDNDFKIYKMLLPYLDNLTADLSNNLKDKDNF